MIPLEIQSEPIIPKIEVMDVEAQVEDLWTTPIREYIVGGVLPADREEARKLKYKAAHYVTYDGILYKRGFNKPLLKCISGNECMYIMREVHEGICGNHNSGASLAHKILRQGFYWPTLKKDAYEFARACDSSQRFANNITNPAAPLKPMSSPWPFAVWGID